MSLLTNQCPRSGFSCTTFIYGLVGVNHVGLPDDESIEFWPSEFGRGTEEIKLIG